MDEQLLAWLFVLRACLLLLPDELLHAGFDVLSDYLFVEL